MDKIYFGEFKNRADVEKVFDVKLDDSINILCAYYGTGGYNGWAYVFYQQEGKLYEVDGVHCSCFGLEGQWEPDETSFIAIKHVLDKGTKYDIYDEDFKKRLYSLIEQEKTNE